MPTQLLLLSFFFFFLSTERIDASYFKAPLATSKSRHTTSEDAWAFFIRYADNEYSNQFNISFAIVDIKCVQIYNKFEAKGLTEAQLQVIVKLIQQHMHNQEMQFRVNF